MKHSIVSVLFVIAAMTGRTQNLRVIPPAPVSREFAKYVNQEVALYNGIPDINIPLYDIKLRGLTIPISLSYHASGIKYAQEDGNVGVGWVLNPGYRVSRTINGFADELTPMPSDFTSALNAYEQNASGGNTLGKVARDQYLAKFVPGTQFNYGRLDGQYDQFTFSTPTAGGGFIIADRSTKTVATNEESNLLIDYVTGQASCPSLDGIKGFQIIDDKGNKYAFGEYFSQNDCVLETASAYYGGTVATAWGISKITTPTAEEVEFTYWRDAAGEFTDHMRTFTVSEGSGNSGNCDLPTITNEDIFTGHGYYTFSPDEIASPNETILFHYGGDPLYPKTIWKIEIMSATGNKIKTIEFFYSQDSHHTFLDHLTIQDSEEHDVETYRFEYYGKNTEEIFTFDHYGNYLTADRPNTFYHAEFLDDPIVASGDNGGSSYCFNQTMLFYLEGLTASREPHQESSFAPSNFSLKKIVYPTGGYTEYEYEHGKYRDVGEIWPVRNAGIRIAKITSFDPISQRSILKRYAYGTDESGYGYAQAWLLHPEYLFVKEMARMNLSPALLDAEMQRVITYSSTIQGDVSSVFHQSGFVKYPCVTEYHSFIASTGIGKTIYSYDVGNLFDVWTLPTRNIPPNEVYGGSPYYVQRYRLWDKPLLKRKVAYLYSNSEYVPVQEVTFEYAEASSTYGGLVVEQSASNGNSEINVESYGPYWDRNMLERYFNYGEYFVEIGRNLLTHKAQYEFVNGDTIATDYWYDYSNLLLSKETVTRSTGDRMVNFTSYPLDYPSGTVFIDDMILNRLVSYPVEEVSVLEKVGSQSITSGSIHQYKPGGKGLLETKWSIEAGLPISLASFKFSNRSLGILPSSGIPTTFLKDTRYKKQITFDSYDISGNILQHHMEDHANVSYVWSYNRTYPIAMVENADYSTVQAVLGGTMAVANFSALASPTNEQVRSFLTPLYTHASLANAIVHAYTYKPLFGMTSSTSPNGLATYYEYDAFGRLKIVRDKDNNILKTYSYHYRGQ